MPGALDPTGTLIAGQACTALGLGEFSTGLNPPKFTIGGKYTIVITDPNNTMVTYDLSLERLSPAPPDGIPLVYNKTGTFKVNPPTAQDAFTFSGSTTCTSEITASINSSQTQDVCLQVFDPTGTSVAGQSCTALGLGEFSVSLDVTPSQNGTYVVVAAAAGNDSTVNYNLELAPLVGRCPAQKPKCFLSDSLSYNATYSTLTMDFTVGTPSPARWDAWLVNLNDSAPVSISGFPHSLPTTEQAKMVTATQTGLAPSGKVGVLSVLTTPTQGITCSSLQTINTGTPQ